MKLQINGKVKDIHGSTLKDVVAHYELLKDFVVTEVDGDIVDREDWDSFKLKKDMKIEIVQFVGGG